MAVRAGAGANAGAAAEVASLLAASGQATIVVDPAGLSGRALERFTSQLATKDSISDQIYRDIVSKQPSSGSGWHTRRGPQGPLARRPQPLYHSWGGLFSKKKVDSAQLFRSL